MDRIFLEGASTRRRFLDRLVCGFDPVHWSRLSAYEKALRHRARLLRDSGSAADAAWLAVLEDSMAQNGVALAAARIETLVRLDAACRESSGVFPRAGLRLTGVVEEALGSMPALDTGGEAGSCSTGEQKALLIAILLAHARLVAGLRGAVPLLLLDEVTAHLDAERRSGLFAAILDLGAQAWLAGTDAALFQELRGSAQFFSVAAASITPG